MSPTRRTILAAAGLLAGTSLAGCLGTSGAGGGHPTDTPTEPPTDTPTPEPLPDGGDGGDGSGTRPRGTGGPGVTLVGTDDAPDLPLSPSVSVLEDTATEEHPPSFRVTLTNTGEESLVVGESRAIRFQYVVDDAGLLQLLPAGEEYPVEEGNCWRLTEGIATTEEFRTEELAAGASVSADVELYALSTYDGCLPVGEFRFETRYAVDPLSEESGGQARWGFSVLLE